MRYNGVSPAAYLLIFSANSGNPFVGNIRHSGNMWCGNNVLREERMAHIDRFLPVDIKAGTADLSGLSAASRESGSKSICTHGTPINQFYVIRDFYGL